MSEPEILTADEVAEFLRVTPARVRELLDSGALVGFKVGGEWRIVAAEVTAFLERETQRTQLQTLGRELADPHIWARQLQQFPELRKSLEWKKFAEGTMGAFLKEALRQAKLEAKAENVVPFRPKTK